VSSLRIASCPLVREGAGPRPRWNAYAGGFYLRTRSVCVPLVVRVGGRSRTVRFGVGRPCPPQTQPFSSAMRSASARLRAPSLRIAALR
jgi:hypothetical protein